MVQLATLLPLEASGSVGDSPATGSLWLSWRLSYHWKLVVLLANLLPLEASGSVGDSPTTGS